MIVIVRPLGSLLIDGLPCHCITVMPFTWNIGRGILCMFEGKIFVSFPCRQVIKRTRQMTSRTMCGTQKAHKNTICCRKSKWDSRWSVERRRKKKSWEEEKEEEDEEEVKRRHFTMPESVVWWNFQQLWRTLKMCDINKTYFISYQSLVTMFTWLDPG